MGYRIEIHDTVVEDMPEAKSLRLHIDQQSFDLSFLAENCEEADWMEAQLSNALERLKVNAVEAERSANVKVLTDMELPDKSQLGANYRLGYVEALDDAAAAIEARGGK